MNFFERVPKEIILSIIAKLRLNDWKSLALVDKEFNSLVKESLRQLWQDSIKRKDADDLKDCLVHGFVPPDVNAKVTMIIEVEYEGRQGIHKREVSRNLISVLLHRATKNTDIISFYTADKLLKQGATLPPLPPLPSDIKKENKAEYFKYLIDYLRCTDLYIALRTNPKLIQEQDETGKTLLHYGATIKSPFINKDNIFLVLHLLCNAPSVDFSIRDNDGNTPLHLAALNCGDSSKVYEWIFPKYLEYALKNHFDFSIQNKQGETVLHIAAKIRNMKTSTMSSNPPGVPRYFISESKTHNVVKIFLEKCPKLYLDDLSSSGATAFYYAIESMCLTEAHTLLDKGANPILFAVNKPEKNSLKIIEDRIDFYKAQPDKAKHNDLIKQLTELKQRILMYIFHYILNYHTSNYDLFKQVLDKNNNPSSPPPSTSPKPN